MDSSASDIPESTDNRMDESCVEKDTNSAFLQELFVGQQIDVLDTVGRWTEAEVGNTIILDAILMLVFDILDIES